MPKKASRRDQNVATPAMSGPSPDMSKGPLFDPFLGPFRTPPKSPKMVKNGHFWRFLAPFLAPPYYVVHHGVLLTPYMLLPPYPVKRPLLPVQNRAKWDRFWPLFWQNLGVFGEIVEDPPQTPILPLFTRKNAQLGPKKADFRVFGGPGRPCGGSCLLYTSPSPRD